MSSEKSSNRLLIVEADPVLLDTLRTHFESLNYSVHTATTGQAALDHATTHYPHLVLLALQLDDMDGLEVFRTLRRTPRTGHIPVMVFASAKDALRQNQILEEGVYDVIEKPVDVDILALRVRNTLRRAERDGLTEPRTGLPTGRLLDEKLAALDEQKGWYRLDLRIDHFVTFRDRYGFVSANEVLRFTGNLITQVIAEIGSSEDFIGQRSGSEEFVILTTQKHGPALKQVLTERVNQALISFYNFVEREQGHVLVDDGAGGQVEKPLMSIHVNVTEGEADPNVSYDPVVDADDAWVDADESPPTDTPPAPSSSATFEW